MTLQSAEVSSTLICALSWVEEEEPGCVSSCLHAGPCTAAHAVSNLALAALLQIGCRRSWRESADRLIYQRSSKNVSFCSVVFPWLIRAPAAADTGRRCVWAKGMKVLESFHIRQKILALSLCLFSLHRSAWSLLGSNPAWGSAG